VITSAQLLAYYASGGPFATALQSTYRYRTSNILTGQVMGDWLPFEVQSFSDVINGGGTFTGSLNLVPDYQQNLQNLAAITPRKAVLWCLQDNVPVWAGQINTWNPTTVLPPPQMPVQANTMESILSGRIIQDDLTFTGMDVSDMARAIVQYAFSQTPNGQVAGITYAAGESGITDSLTFDGSQNGDCLSALGTLVSTYGIEFHFRPYLTQGGNLQISFDVGNPLGQPYPASGLAYNFPGNLLDYEFSAAGTGGGNQVIGSAQADNSGDGTSDGTAYAGSAIDSTDIANGYPLSSVVVSPTGVTLTSDDQVSAYCAGLLPSLTATQVAPLLVLGNGQQPQLNVTQLGSYAEIALTSPQHPGPPGGTPGWMSAGRVVSWECYPPSSQQAEYLQIQIGAMPFEGSVLT
jgi:hypothetical protein